MRHPRSLPIDVGPFHKRLFVKKPTPWPNVFILKTLKGCSWLVFLAGLSKEIEKYVRIMNPQTLDQALKIALSVQEAEKQEKFSQSYYGNLDDSSRLRSPSPTHSASDKPRRSAVVKRVVEHTQAQRHRTGGNNDRKTVIRK